MRALDQNVEIAACGGFVQHTLEHTPQRELAGDSEFEELELDEPTQGRVAGELAIRLQPTELLGGPCRRLLGAVYPDAELGQHRPQGLSVGVDLLGEPAKELAELVVAIVLQRSSRERYAERGAGEVVIEVDGKGTSLHGSGLTANA
ncbi:MAG TPA: hypothetical protein VE401_09295 [Solirubrobacterales bacterium]|nr:hypothetical protein [Solirubrobacterales bacterium]